MSVQAEVEDVIWVVKEMADQKLSNTPQHSMSSLFNVIIQLSPFCLSPCTKSNIISDRFLACHFGSTDILDSDNEVYIT